MLSDHSYRNAGRHHFGSIGIANKLSVLCDGIIRFISHEQH